MGNGEETRFIAAGHMDKAPMCLIATCGTSLIDAQFHVVRERKYVHGGILKKKTNVMHQPHLFSMYRSNFNVVDVADKLALGPHSIIDVWVTRNAFHRLFAATLAFIESNAYHAIRCTHPHFKDTTRAQWRHLLSTALRNYGTPMLTRTPATPLAHSKLVPLDGQLRCRICTPLKGHSPQVRWACTCGLAMCPPTSGRDCYARHLAQIQQGQVANNEKDRAKRGRQ
jgi:hypothetical protein